MMTGTFFMDIREIQPSQLFINLEKLLQVIDALDPAKPELCAPLPVKQLGTEIIFTDGHTRALAAYLLGLRDVFVYWEQDDLDWEAYEICVEWCRDAGIHTVVDLVDNIIESEEYELLWLKRCKEMHQDLERRRRQMPLQQSR